MIRSIGISWTWIRDLPHDLLDLGDLNVPVLHGDLRYLNRSLHLLDLDLGNLPSDVLHLVARDLLNDLLYLRNLNNPILDHGHGHLLYLLDDLDGDFGYLDNSFEVLGLHHFHVLGPRWT